MKRFTIVLITALRLACITFAQDTSNEQVEKDQWSIVSEPKSWIVSYQSNNKVIAKFRIANTKIRNARNGETRPATPEVTEFTWTPNKFIGEVRETCTLTMYDRPVIGDGFKIGPAPRDPNDPETEPEPITSSLTLKLKYRVGFPDGNSYTSKCTLPTKHFYYTPSSGGGADFVDQSYPEFAGGGAIASRKVGLDGFPIPGDKPQVNDEDDLSANETFVDMFSQYLTHSVSDVRVVLPNTDMLLQVRRNWEGEIRSNRESPALDGSYKKGKPFGAGWGSNLGARLEFEVPSSSKDATLINIVDEEGASYQFHVVIDQNYNHHYVPYPSNKYENRDIHNTLKREGDSLVFAKKFGTTLRFTQATGVDRDTRIADSEVAGRVRFIYYYRLTSVSDRCGSSISFEYANEGSITPTKIVHDQSGMFLSITTDSQGLVERVTDPRGNSVTYDSYKHIGDGYIGCYVLERVSHEASDQGKGIILYQYDIATDSPNPVDTRIYKNLDLMSITDQEGGVYSFAHEWDVAKKVFYNSSVFRKNGQRRVVCSVTGPASIGAPVSLFRRYARGTLKLHPVFQSIYGDATIPYEQFNRLLRRTPYFGIYKDFIDDLFVQAGYHTTAAVDWSGNSHVYEFTDGVVEDLHSLLDIILTVNPDELPGYDIPKAVFFKRMAVHHLTGSRITDVYDAGSVDTAHRIGFEEYEFEPGANMAVKRALDISGNATVYEYADGYEVNHEVGDYRGAIFGKYSEPSSERRFTGSDREGNVISAKSFLYGAYRVMSEITDGNKFTCFGVDTFGRRTSEVIKKDGVLSSSSTTNYVSDERVKSFIASNTIERIGPTEYSSTLTTKFEPNYSGTYGPIGMVRSETVQVTNPGGSQLPELSLTTSYVYDANGNRKTIVDPRGNETSFDYDTRNRVVKITLPPVANPTGQNVAATKEFIYDTRGKKLAQKDENGSVTIWRYDALRRPTDEIRVTGTPPTFTRAGVEAYVPTSADIVTKTAYAFSSGANSYGGQVITITDPRGNQTVRYYDQLRRLAKEISPDGVTSEYAYGANCGGSIFSSSSFKPTTLKVYKGASFDGSPRRIQTDITYDSLYHPTSKTISWTFPGADGASVSSSATWTTDCDRWGNVLTEKNPLGQITTTTYDAENRPTSVTYADGSTVATAYTGFGR